MYFPSPVLTTTLMRLRVELNSFTFTISYEARLGPEMPALDMSTVTTGAGVKKSYPRHLAAFTSASSSGDAARYVTSPVAALRSGMTVWHTASSVRNSWIMVPRRPPSRRCFSSRGSSKWMLRS